MVYSILFQPLSHSSFRWQGEFGPQARGPQAYALSMVLPLPSTIAGLLAGHVCSVNYVDPCSSNEESPYSGVEYCLSLLGDVKLRGPYIYVELRGAQDGYVICMPHGRPGSWKLYCISDGLRRESIDASGVQSIGIALDSLSKTILEGYIYTAVFFDASSTAVSIAGRFGGKVSRYGVLVEVHGDINGKVLKEIDERVVALGGEQKPARIQVMDSTPALAVAEKAVEKFGECYYWHIVSPILCCNGTRDCKFEKSLEQVYIEPRRLANNLANMVKAGAALCRDKAVNGRLFFTAIGLGYDMCRGRKRKYCRAIMPGAGLYIKLRDDNWRSLYRNGVGSYSSLGWGTILPAPEPSEPL